MAEEGGSHKTLSLYPKVADNSDGLHEAEGIASATNFCVLAKHTLTNTLPYILEALSCVTSCSTRLKRRGNCQLVQYGCFYLQW
jgi:hypothetical protein